MLSTDHYDLYEGRQVLEALLALGVADNGGFPDTWPDRSSTPGCWGQLWGSQADTGRISISLPLRNRRVGNKLEDGICSRISTLATKTTRTILEPSIIGRVQSTPLQWLLQLGLLPRHRYQRSVEQEGRHIRQDECPVFESQL